MYLEQWAYMQAAHRAFEAQRAAETVQGHNPILTFLAGSLSRRPGSLRAPSAEERCSGREQGILFDLLLGGCRGPQLGSEADADAREKLRNWPDTAGSASSRLAPGRAL